MSLVAEKGIKEILNVLSEDVLKQLATLTTNNLINIDSVTTKEEAIRVIVQYSPDYSTILNRKCIKREILFQYIHENKIPISQSTKLGLIQSILNYWNKSVNVEKTEKQQVSEVNKEQDAEVKEMAKQFSEWFYKMLNEEETIDENHFWSNCELTINLIGPTSQEEHVSESNRNVVQLIHETKRQHQLFFNPNLTPEGVLGKMDPHGLVKIFTCGTLHTNNTCVGVFEQVFALVRDPFADNNWKIKNTKLNLRSRHVTEIPKLCSEFTSDGNQAIVSVNK